MLYCLKSCLVKEAAGEKIKQEAAGVQPHCWGCGHLRGGREDGAGVGHRGPDLPASTPARHCVTPLFVADIEKTNQTSGGCRGRGLRHLCWFKSAHARLFRIAQAGCRDCPAVSECHRRALDGFLISWTPALTSSCISAVNRPK